MRTSTKQLYLTVVVDLPDDAFAAAEVYAQLKAPWVSLGEALHTLGVTFTSNTEEMSVRPKVQRGPRKPRLVTPPTGEAA